MKQPIGFRGVRIAPLAILLSAILIHAAPAQGVGKKVAGAGQGAGKETKEAVADSGTEVWGATRDALVTLLSLPVRLAETIGSGGDSTQARLRREKAAKAKKLDPAAGAKADSAAEAAELTREERKQVATGIGRVTGYLAGMAGGVTEETVSPTVDALASLASAAITTLKRVIVLPFRILNSAATGGESAGVVEDEVRSEK